MLMFNILLIVAIMGWVTLRIAQPRRTIKERFLVSWRGIFCLLHAELFFISALTCGGNAGFCVQNRYLFLGPYFDFTDWSTILYTQFVLTIVHYVFVEQGITIKIT